jgi:hypothetical protein
MDYLVCINRTALKFDAAKFHELVHDHSLTIYSEEFRTEWLRKLGGVVSGAATSWTHSFIHGLVELKCIRHPQHRELRVDVGGWS